jgi:3-deoxy-D-manno-octulosonic-acid transferase
MLRIYTVLSTLSFLILLPLIAIISLLKKKYRNRFFQKIGFFFHNLSTKNPDRDKPVIWIHALSVGEVTSALPLIKGIKQRFPKSIIFFSTTTRTGRRIAEQTTGSMVDFIIYSPFDIYFAIHRFIKKIKPSIFILIETDFWPCWLYILQKHSIPCLLANGRCSQKSFASYRRFAFLSRPMFNCFDFLAMQTTSDADNIKLLGIDEKKIISPGNLKFDAALKDNTIGSKLSRAELGLPATQPLLICGSTHHGEEEIIFQAYRELINNHPELILMIAPRDINRTGTIVKLAGKYNLQVIRRSQRGQVTVKEQFLKSKSRNFSGNNHCSKSNFIPEEDHFVYLLDTLGELFPCYQFADICFIGGSMVPAGGHNPLEAAVASLPVLFGPHMEDFSEISNNLVENGGAVIVHNHKELTKQVSLIIRDKTRAAEMGKAAKQQVTRRHGVVRKYMDTISGLLGNGN